MKYTVSVVIPVYNREKYIERCVMSVLRQKNSEHFQIILVDDGSDDRSPAICDKLQDKYDNIFVVHQTNAGVSAARNTGIDMAQGEWLSFVDSDDFLLDGFYEKLLSGEAADLLCCDFSVNNKDFPLIANYIKPGVYKKQDFKNVLYPVMAESTVFYSACNKVFKTSIVKDNDLKFTVGLKLGEDMNFVYEYVKFIESFKFVDEKLYDYYINDDNTTHIVKRGYETHEMIYRYLSDYFEAVGFDAADLKQDYLYNSLGAIYTAAKYLGLFSAFLYISNILRKTMFYREYKSKQIYECSPGVNGYLDRFIIKKRVLLIIVLVRFCEFKSKRKAKDQNDS